MVKAYTKGWRDSSGEMNINMKIGDSRGPSSTIMIRPNERVYSLINKALGFVKMGDGAGPNKVFSFFARKDLILVLIFWLKIFLMVMKQSM